MSTSSVTFRDKNIDVLGNLLLKCDNCDRIRDMNLNATLLSDFIKKVKKWLKAGKNS